jgi:hypothetical protein
MLNGQTFSETVITSQIDGAALTAAAAASCIPAAAKFTLPPNWCQIGRKILIRAAGKITSLITTPGTARFDVRFGTDVVFDSLAVLLDSVAAHTDVGWWLEIELTVRKIGTVAELMGHGIFISEDILGVPATAPKGSLVAMLPWNAAPAVGATFDSTVSNVVDFYFTQTAATGELTCQQYSVSLLN